MEKIDTYRFAGTGEGPVFLILGAVHGNEKCGTVALARLRTELDGRIVTLDRGTLVIAPVCNPEAYRRDVRFVQENLNRIISRAITPRCDEDRLAHQVMDLIDAADVVLDLHSYMSGEQPFLFLDRDTPDNRALAAALDIPDWVTGWNDAYAAAGRPDLNAGDTMSYAGALGKTAVLVECGAHADPAAAAVAYRSIRRALAHLGMMAPAETAPPCVPRVTRMTTIYAKDKDGDFPRDWRHLDRVRMGDVLAVFADGDVLHAPADGVILLPKRNAAVGGEWFYFGTDDSLPV